MTWHSLPLFVRLQGRPVILLGEGEAAEAKRRLLERAGAVVATDHPEARLAIVAMENDAEATAAVEQLRGRGMLVNAVDRPAMCDFTLPAIVDRDPVLVAIGTGGVSAGLAATLRQRLEALLPAGLGRLAAALFAARRALRDALPDPAHRRRALATALSAGGALDPLGTDPDVSGWLAAVGQGVTTSGELIAIHLPSPDPDDLTLRQSRALANADRVYHHPDVPAAILARARADAPRSVVAAPPHDENVTGFSVYVELLTRRGEPEDLA